MSDLDEVQLEVLIGLLVTAITIAWTGGDIRKATERITEAYSCGYRTSQEELERKLKEGRVASHPSKSLC